MCGQDLGTDCLTAYLLSGGSPVALNELAVAGALPEYVMELVRDWILGEIARVRGITLEDFLLEPAGAV